MSNETNVSEIKAPAKPRHSVDTEALQAVLNYLNGRPYGEVSAIIAAVMQSAQPIQEQAGEWK